MEPSKSQNRMGLHTLRFIRVSTNSITTFIDDGMGKHNKKNLIGFLGEKMSQEALLKLSLL